VLNLLRGWRGVAGLARRPHARLLVSGAALLTAAAACDRATGPLPVSYLAIVALVDTPPGVSPGARYGYRVREVSGTLGIDTTIVAQPRDTVFLRLPVATYEVALSGLPTWCKSRYGPQQDVAVFDPPSTSLARYFVSCLAPLTIHVSNEGPGAPDPEIVYRLRGGGGDRLGILHPHDTIRFDHLTPGDYELGLSLVAENCLVTGNGGAEPRITVPDGGGAELTLRISCSDPARQPHLMHTAATFRDGVSAFVLRVKDADRDIERYFWDITDCRRTSVLPGGTRVRRGLSSGRTHNLDTITVVAAFETGLTAADVAGRCTALRVEDQYGNSTPVVELPIRDVPGAAPSASLFNAFTIGTLAIRTELAVGDGDGDFVGVFAAARTRDGVLFLPPDADPDVGIYNAAGYLGSFVPELSLGSRIQYGDVYAVIVYLIDEAGHVTRLEDSDVLR
jgi:hypothetical protein